VDVSNSVEVMMHQTVRHPQLSRCTWATSTCCRYLPTWKRHPTMARWGDCHPICTYCRFWARPAAFESLASPRKTDRGCHKPEVIGTCW